MAKLWMVFLSLENVLTHIGIMNVYNKFYSEIYLYTKSPFFFKSIISGVLLNVAQVSSLVARSAGQRQTSATTCGSL